jgi:type IV secretion system protein VirB5
MSNPTLSLPNTECDKAEKRYLEIYGTHAVRNSYLNIALFCVSLVALGLAFVNVRLFLALQNQPRVVVRVNEVGRAEAINYGTTEYQPREAEIRYFLMQFVQMHYRRIRATLKEDYSRSLYFIDEPLARGIIEANKKDDSMESFLVGQGQEVDIKIDNVSIQDLRQPPYKATVDFERIHYGTARQEMRREKYVANIVFTLRDRVPNDMIPINPLGFMITYFREDQGF